MEPKMILSCPVYLVVEAGTGKIPTMREKNEEWFPVYPDRELAEQAASRKGENFRVSPIANNGEMRQPLEANAKIAGILVNNPAETSFWNPVRRQDLLI